MTVNKNDLEGEAKWMEESATDPFYSSPVFICDTCKVTKCSECPHEKPEPIMRDRYGKEFSIGDSVRNVHRRTPDCQWDQNYVGRVISLDPERFPLIGVDCGLRFISYMPGQDLEIFKEKIWEFQVDEARLENIAYKDYLHCISHRWWKNPVTVTKVHDSWQIIGRKYWPALNAMANLEKALNMRGLTHFDRELLCQK